MTSRSNEAFREALRAEMGGSNLFTNARLMDTASIARFVDEDALNKSRMSTFNQMRRLNSKLIAKNGLDVAVQKAERKAGGNTAPLSQIGMEDEIEQIYFDTYGESFDGGPVVDKPGTKYRCPCGVRMFMDAHSLPDECPRCHRLTPMGRLVKDGRLRRRAWATRPRSWRRRPPSWRRSSRGRGPATARRSSRSSCARCWRCLSAPGP